MSHAHGSLTRLAHPSGAPAVEEALLRASNGTALVPFLTAGFPTPSEFASLLIEVARVSDVVEIGLPFADPVADGPVIQRASERAAAEGGDR